MLPAVERRGVLVNLAAEGVIPVLGGCAGALVGGPEGGIAGVAVGQVVEKAINFFGARIVERWCAWFRGRPPEEQAAALAELAALSPEEARREAAEALDRLAPDARPADRSLALEYLTAIPRTLGQALPLEPIAGDGPLPPTASWDNPHDLLQLLPVTLPPYPVPSDLPNSPYRLTQLLGCGGFGAVYRATTASLQHLPLAIKFCLDPGLTAALHQERSLLERLMKAGGEDWSHRVVRLYGYDLDHRTPYLVYEYVAGGDLVHYLKRRRQQQGRPLNAAEVLDLITQMVEGLAFAHRHGLVHRDLKPANILVSGDVLKLADFGLGTVVAARAVRASQIGVSTVDQLSAADKVSLFRGAGTPLYMSPEQRRGAAPDPRHDLYSLGVTWFQLLVGDVSRELHPGWAKELSVKFNVPREHRDLIEQCVGWFEERPKDAGELLELIKTLPHGPGTALAVPEPAPVADAAPVAVARSPPSGDEAPRERLRRVALLALLRRLFRWLTEFERLKRPAGWRILGVGVGAGFLAGLTLFAILIQTWKGSVKATPSAAAGSDRAGAKALAAEEPEAPRPFMRPDEAGWVGMLVGVVVGTLTVFLQILVRASRLSQARQGVAARLRELTAEFPDFLQSWGGAVVFHNPDVVQEAIRSLESAAS
jgi:serine/threonine protein kinase